jgi:hypothetical protein
VLVEITSEDVFPFLKKAGSFSEHVVSSVRLFSVYLVRLPDPFLIGFLTSRTELLQLQLCKLLAINVAQKKTSSRLPLNVAVQSHSHRPQPIGPLSQLTLAIFFPLPPPQNLVLWETGRFNLF